MVVLPLKLDFAEVGSVSKLTQHSEGHVCILPNTVKATVFLVSVELNPVTALVPRHTDLFEFGGEVN